MMRRFALLGFALALAMALPMGFEAEAGKKKMKHNACKGQTLTGQSVTWKCKLDEKCCFGAVTGMGTCAPKSGMCL
jgi:hypothetical protein